MRIDITPVASIEGIRLRHFVNEDSLLIQKLNQQSRVTQALVERDLLSVPVFAEKLVEQVISQYDDYPGLGSWIIERSVGKADEWEFLGWCNLCPVLEDVIPADELHPDNRQMVELGMRLGAHAWGSQISLRIGQCLLGHAFESLSQPRVLIHCLPQNRSAVYCAGYLGFVKTKRLSYLKRSSVQFELGAQQYQDRLTLTLKQKKTSGLNAVRSLAHTTTSVRPLIEVETC